MSTAEARSAIGWSAPRPFSRARDPGASGLVQRPYTVSVGSTTGRPAPIASTASSTRRSSVDDSLTSREIFPDRDLLVAQSAQQAGDGPGSAVRNLERERCARREAADRLLGDRLRLAGLDQRGAGLVVGDF